MQNVRLCFETGSHFIARAIRWFTKGRVNHVAVTYDGDDFECEMVVEALARGVFLRESRNRTWTYVVTPKYPEAVDHMRATKSYIGRKYDVEGFALFGLIILAWRWFRIKVKKPHLTSKAQFCSEYAAHLAVAKLGPVVGDPQWVSPEKLLEIFEAYPAYYDVRRVG